MGYLQSTVKNVKMAINSHLYFKFVPEEGMVEII